MTDAVFVLIPVRYLT